MSNRTLRDAGSPTLDPVLLLLPASTDPAVVRIQEITAAHLTVLVSLRYSVAFHSARYGPNKAMPKNTPHPMARPTPGPVPTIRATSRESPAPPIQRQPREGTGQRKIGM